MLSYDTSFTVPGRTPEECFDYVATPENGTEWTGSAKAITAEGEPGVGRRITATVDLIVSFDITNTVTTYDRPTRYAFQADKPMKVAYDFRFGEESDGTRVDCHLDVDPGKFIPGGSFLLKGRFKKEFEGDMDRLEQRLRAG